jgi:hypothetical protein
LEAPFAFVTVTLIDNHWVDKTCNEPSRSAFIERRDMDAPEQCEADFLGYGLIISNSFVEPLIVLRLSLSYPVRLLDLVPYFIQTPNKSSPIDPHYPRPYVPFFALYPRIVQACLLTLGSPGSGAKDSPVASALEHENERPFGVPMSVLAVNRG